MTKPLNISPIPKVEELPPREAIRCPAKRLGRRRPTAARCAGRTPRLRAIVREWVRRRLRAF